MPGRILERHSAEFLHTQELVAAFRDGTRLARKNAPKVRTTAIGAVMNEIEPDSHP